MRLILTEKPSVSKQVRNALAADARYVTLFKATKKEPPVGAYINDEFVICNSVGHIVNLKAPKDIDAKKYGWNLSCLPYVFPNPLPLEISEPSKKVFNGIQKCFDMYEYDEVIIATDGDREGQNIWRKIDLMLSPYRTPLISRMWLSEWTPDGIRKAYKNRFDNKEKDSLAEAARCREDADYIIGMNCTAALTAKYSSNYGDVVSIGRVMGPTMKIVTDRENEIKNFKPKDYIAVSAVTESDEPGRQLVLKAKKQQFSLAEADALAKVFPSSLILNKTVKKTTKKCPELYDATSIAQDMNKRYGFSAKKTSDIIQKLYQDYTLTTYPGTNSTKMSEGSAKMAYDALKNLQIFTDKAQKIMTEGWKPAKHVVTAEGLAHEAITPVYNTSTTNLAVLSADERKVYEAIVERFLQVFYPNAEFEEVTVKASAAGEEFETKGKTLLKKGWMEISNTGKDVLLPVITDGKSYPAKMGRENKKTTPPSRFTEDTLLQAMKNAGRFVYDKEEIKILKETEGLGTGRTRPAIIENIKKRGYFTLKGKSILPTAKCLELFEVMPPTTLSSPSLTAQFEQMIQDVEDGKMTYEEYIAKVETDVCDMIDKIKKDSSNRKIGGKMEGSFGNCPKCGKPLKETEKAVGCSGYKEGCDFTIWKTVAGKKLTDTQIKQLLEKGQTSTIKGFTSRTGSKFDAQLKLNDETLKVEFAFGEKKDWGICPVCGKPMQESAKAVGCSGWQDGCKFTIWKNMSGKNLTEAQIREIIRNKGTLRPVKGFKKKDGTPFKSDPNVVWDDASQRFTFVWPERK